QRVAKARPMMNSACPTFNVKPLSIFEMAGTARRAPLPALRCCKSIQRETLRISAHVGRRVERLAVDRAIVVLAPEGWHPELRRIGIIGKLAVAGQPFGAGVEPGAFCHIDP